MHFWSISRISFSKPILLLGKIQAGFRMILFHGLCLLLHVPWFMIMKVAVMTQNNFDCSAAS